MLTERAKVETPYPCPPATFLSAISGLVGSLGVDYHRVSVGFPGLVRRGRVYHIPSLSRREYGGAAGPRADGGVARVRPRRCADRGVLGAGQGRQRRRRAGLRGRHGRRLRARHHARAPAWAPHCSPPASCSPTSSSGTPSSARARRSRSSSATWPARRSASSAGAPGVLKALDGVRPVPLLRPRLPGRRELQAPGPGRRCRRRRPSCRTRRASSAAYGCGTWTCTSDGSQVRPTRGISYVIQLLSST